MGSDMASSFWQEMRSSGKRSARLANYWRLPTEAATRGGTKQHRCCFICDSKRYGKLPITVEPGASTPGIAMPGQLDSAPSPAQLLLAGKLACHIMKRLMKPLALGLNS